MALLIKETKTDLQRCCYKKRNITTKQMIMYLKAHLIEKLKQITDWQQNKITTIYNFLEIKHFRITLKTNKDQHIFHFSINVVGS